MTRLGGQGAEQAGPQRYRRQDRAQVRDPLRRPVHWRLVSCDWWTAGHVTAILVSGWSQVPAPD